MALPRHSDPLGLYVSVPFCRAKCTFCNFASGVYPASAMPAYIGAVRRQLAGARAWAAARGLLLPRRVDTVYLGGGTPSLLPPVLVQELFAAIHAEFAIDPDAEITLEGAPLQLEPATLEAALEAGVNRISFGVQSFVDGEARATARTHSGAEALGEIERIHRAGVAHISADLIAGLPGQTSGSWARSVDLLVDAPLNHASIYMFELDEDSRLGAEALRGGIRYGAALLPHDDAVADWYEQACGRLAQAGLAQYEISNFARPGGQSRHNERYWRRSPYLGLGVDAHSMLRSETGAAARFATGDELEAFLAQPVFQEPDRLTPAQELEEAWFLGLRRNAGISLAALRQEFGPEPVEAYRSVLAGLAEDGLLSLRSEIVALTARGRLLSNEVFARLLDDAAHSSNLPSPPSTVILNAAARQSAWRTD